MSLTLRAHTMQDSDKKCFNMKYFSKEDQWVNKNVDKRKESKTLLTDIVGEVLEEYCTVKQEDDLVGVKGLSLVHPV